MMSALSEITAYLYGTNILKFLLTTYYIEPISSLG